MTKPTAATESSASTALSTKIKSAVLKGLPGVLGLIGVIGGLSRSYTTIAEETFIKNERRIQQLEAYEKRTHRKNFFMRGHLSIEDVLSRASELLEEEVLSAEELLLQQLEANKEKYPEMMGNFYQAIRTIQNPEDPLVLVNKNYQLAATYEPEDLILPRIRTVSGTTNQTIYLKKEAAKQLERMFKAALKEKVYLIATSGYRSYQTQASLYQQYLRLNGAEYTDGISARPGHSEHQTGLAIDLTSDEIGQQLHQRFANTTEGRWIAQHAHEYGYIIRYPENREAETGYQYEPWHLRYVGVEVATLLKEKNWILEEYILAYQS